jgi:hypothetical protein
MACGTQFGRQPNYLQFVLRKKNPFSEFDSCEKDAKLSTYHLFREAPSS